MAKHVFAFGFEMTEKEKAELEDGLREDIVCRYNNEEYWNKNIIEEFAYRNKLFRR